MKNARQSLTILAMAVLPLILSAQSPGTAGTTGAGSSSRSASVPEHSPDSPGPLPQPNPSGSSTYSPGLPGMAASGAAKSGSSAKVRAEQKLRRVDAKFLNGQLTAKNLIGKDVYDRDLKRVGKVVDVALRTQPTSPNLNENTAITQVSAEEPSRGKDLDLSLAEPSVIVARGSASETSKDLICAALSQVIYDANANQLRLNVSEGEIENLAVGGSESRR